MTVTSSSTTKLTPEEQAAVLRWPEVLDIPIFPAKSKIKKIYYNEWNNLDFGLVDFKTNLINGDYDEGIAVRTGRTISGKYYLIVLDFDGWDSIVAWFASWDNVVALSKKTLIEWHQDKGKIHVFLFSTEAIPTRKIMIKDCELEVRCENEEKKGTAIFVSPSIHKEGRPYSALGVDNIAVMEPIDLLRIKLKIDRLCDTFMSDADKDRYDAMLDEPGLILGVNSGRHDATKFKAIRYYFKYSGEWLGLTDEQRFDRAWQWHIAHCKPPRTRKEFDKICDWIIRNLRQKRDELHEPVREERAQLKQQAAEHYRQHNGYKQKILAGIRDENIRTMLDADIWTQVSENPAKFIVARKQACHICRASIIYSDSGDNQASKKAHLNYGSILIRLFPKQITLHESPLKFLETSERYTIVFENQDRYEVVISGTIDGIISRLKEMPGYVISSYGIAEALTAIIGAFKDDNKLEVDKTVEFEGYYYHDSDVQISKIDLDVKHPRRTKQEVITCIDYLDKRSVFQIWKDKQDNEIDRRDLLASLIQWTIPGPFNFLLKQQNCRPYLKGFALTGERDGAKTSLSEEMLSIHGNRTNEQDPDSIYSVSAGSVNTEAKFGKAVSKTTYAVEFSEFGRVETYGRHEDLVECFKTSVDATIVRRGKKDNRTDAPFPSLSPLIINGNPPFTSKGELLKRYHVAEFSEEDRHDRSPNSPFNLFQRGNKHHWRTLGDWTVRYILDNKQELLLSKKYGAPEIGKKALEAFYKYGDSEVPEWLTWKIPETSLEELDQDIEGIIRSILYNHVHKSLRDNYQIIADDIKDGIKRGFAERIGLCLTHGLWPWIKQVKNSQEKYYIDGSIMELFTQRLPDLTFKKLAEKTGLKYTNTADNRKKILCTKKELEDLLTGEEEG